MKQTYLTPAEKTLLVHAIEADDSDFDGRMLKGRKRALCGVMSSLTAIPYQPRDDKPHVDSMCRRCDRLIKSRAASRAKSQTLLIQAVKFELLLAEGPNTLVTGQWVTVWNWLSATTVLRDWWKLLAPQAHNGCYKGALRVTFADGFVYDGHFGLEHAAPEPLENDIRNGFYFAAGLRKPAKWTDAQYKMVLDRRPGGVDEAKKILATYKFGD